MLVGIGAVVAVIVILQFLTVGGQAYPASNSNPDTAGELARGVPFFVTMWLLLGVPNQAHEIGLKQDGSAQRVLVGVITAAACVLTGAYLLSLHFAGGALQNVRRGPLVAGAVFTAVLVVPAYSALVRAIWRQGLRGVFSVKPWKERWRQAMTEVLRAEYAAYGGWGLLDRTLRELYMYEWRGAARHGRQDGPAVNGR
jgi:hypothetical protein